MKVLVCLTTIMLSVSLLVGCKKEVITVIVDPGSTSEVNRPPGQFAITLDYVSSDTAKITWTESVDPDTNIVRYRVYLNDSLIMSNLLLRNFIFSDLDQSSPYSVKVIAYDDEEAQTEAALTFTTPKFDERFFLRKLDYGKITENAAQLMGQMAKGNDGGYVISGKTDRLVYGTPGVKLFTMKIDSLGNQVWFKTYGFSNFGGFVNITNCSDGYLLVCGDQLIKIDNKGDLLWARSFSNNDAFSTAAVDRSGQIYLAGSSFRDSVNNRISAILRKYDANGNLLWRKTYSPTIWDLFYDIKIASDGNIIVLGKTDRNKVTIGEYNANSKPFEFDFWGLKFAADGTMIWSKLYQHEGEALGGTIIELKNGGYVFAGTSTAPYATHYYLLQKIDKEGNTEWEHADMGTWMSPKSVVETHDNSLVVTGQLSFSYSSAFALYKFEGNGTLAWQKYYQEDFTYISPRTVYPTEDGGYFINAAKSKTYNYGDERNQIYIFKTDDSGNFK